MLRRAPTSKIRRPQRPKQRERRRRREQRPKQRLWNPKRVKISSLMQVHGLILISKMFLAPLHKKHICLILFSILPCSETCHLRCRFEEGVQHLWILRHGLAEGRLSLTFFESETCYFQLYFPAVELDNMLDTVRNWDYDQMSDAEFDGNLAKVKKVLQEGKLVRAQAKAVARELVPYLFFAAFLGVFLFLLHVFGVVFCDFAVNRQLVEAK